MTNTPKPSDVVSMHRSVSLDFIRTSGGYAVRTLRGQKDPGGAKWDPKNNTDQKSEQTLHVLRTGNDNLGIHLHGDLVDVDIDSDAPFLLAALDIFLPKCSHVWGRPSRPRTHRVYLLNTGGTGDFDPANFPILDRIKKIPEAMVEVRGGPKTRGEYSLLPGSLHPDGETYEWADLKKAQASVSVATPDQVLSAIRMAGAVALIAPHWQEGLRNDLTKVLSGFLHKAFKVSETLGGAGWALDLEGSRRLLTVIMDLAEDDPADQRARLKTLEATWEKGERGANLIGGKTLQQLVGIPNILKNLYILLTDSPDAEELEEFINRFAIWQGAGLVVDLTTMGDNRAVSVMRRDAFINSWAHKRVTIGDTRKRATDIFFDIPSVLRIQGFTFTPGKPDLVEEAGGAWLNHWRGFRVPPCAGAVSDDEIHPFTDYIARVVSNGNQEHAHWVTAWLADIFQNPADKCGTALVLVGAPGAGKSILGERIMRRIIGTQHSTVADKVDHLVGGFNSEFDHMIFIQCDEAMNNRQRGTAARLKAMITDDTLRIEQKNVPAHKQPNHIRMLFTSNEVHDAMAIVDGTADRRYTVLRVCEDYAQSGKATLQEKLEFWTRLRDWLDDDANLAKIHRYLLDYGYARADIRKPLVTEAKHLMQQASWPPFDAWLAQMVSRHHPLSERHHTKPVDCMVGTVSPKEILRDQWPDYINYSALVEDFNSFRRTLSGKSEPVNETQIGMLLRERGVLKKELPMQRRRYTDYDERTNKKILQRVYLRQFPTESMLLEFLESKFAFRMGAEPPIDEGDLADGAEGEF